MNNFAGYIGSIKCNVCIDRIRKQEHILEYIGKFVAQIVEIVFADVFTVDFDAAFRDIVNADKRFKKNALARTRSAHDANLFPAGDAQIDMLQERLAVLRDGDVFDLDIRRTANLVGIFRLRDFRFLFEKIHNPAHGDDTVLHLINTVVDLRQKVHNAEDISHARSHNADLELTDENHQSTDRDRGNISDLTDDIEYQTIFGGYVHLLEISVFQIPVDAVEFMLLQLLVREGTDKPYRIDVFLHIQVHIRIAVPDICGNSAGGTGIPYKSEQQYRSNCGRQKEHP